MRQKVSENAPLIGRLVAPHIEHVAKVLNSMMATNKNLPTLLTQANRSKGRAAHRVKTKATATTAIATTVRCQDCGVELADAGRHFCDVCLPEVKTQSVEAFLVAGPAALARARSSGNDPAHGGDSGHHRAQTQRERAAAREAWDREHDGETPDAERFRSDILPRLQNVSLSAMMRTTRLSLRYCSEIRRGIRVPHPMYWEALQAIENI